MKTLIIVCLVLILTGCGADTTQTNTPSGTGTPKPLSPPESADDLAVDNIMGMYAYPNITAPTMMVYVARDGWNRPLLYFVKPGISTCRTYFTLSNEVAAVASDINTAGWGLTNGTDCDASWPAVNSSPTPVVKSVQTHTLSILGLTMSAYDF